MKLHVLTLAGAGIAALGLSVPAAAQRQSDVVFEAGNVELVTTDGGSSEVAEIFEEAIPREKNPNNNIKPKFAITTKDRKFMMTLSGNIPVIMGYDIGNDLYKTSAGINFVTGDIPVPRQDGKKADYYINPYNAQLNFAVVGFAGTKNQISALIRFATNGNNPNVAISRAWIKWRGWTFGSLHTLIQDGYACQPPTIDPEGPCGDVSTGAAQIRYESPSYSGFSFAAGLEMPTFYSSNGVYKGHDYAKYYGTQVSTDANELVPDIPFWIQYQKSPVNRIRFSGVIRNLRYRDLVEQKSRTVVGWGTMLSGNFSFYKPLSFCFQAVYGKGIGNYIQDIAGREISFTPKDDAPGKLTPTPMMGLVFGATYNFNARWQMNAVGSYTRVWDCEEYARIGDVGRVAGNNNYRHATYVAVNCFYNINSYLQWGLEYLYGQRATYALGARCDNRIQTQLNFTF